MNIQLSISLLASDRAASLERCLDSLQPLLMQVPSELIIIFTGTDTQVRDIAARYTDQIIPFTWCNDFSKARNIGLNQARGEWFMYIDDDEWFEDTAEIRDFFLSGEYRKYHSACYKQRNYTDWAGIRHSDFHAFRMSRNSSGLRFINPIHEQMSPWKDPCKYFDDYVHHFGYVRDNVQYMVQTKVSRNIPMLLDDIQKHPLYIKNYIQLIQEYFVDKDWTNAEKYCRKGRTLKADVQERCWLQVSMGEILCKKGDAEQAICEIKTILEANEIEYHITSLMSSFRIKYTLNKQVDVETIFDNCPQAHCYNLYEGKIGACFLPFTTKYFNEYFNLNLPTNEAIDLYDKTLTTKKLKTYLQTPIERCHYCMPKYKEITWDTIDNPSGLSDWIIEYSDGKFNFS